MNLKEQLESARNYALERIEKGDFNVIDCYYDENIESVRVVVEIDSCRLDLVVLEKFNAMYQTGVRGDVILFNTTINIPTKIKELAEEELEKYNSNKKELEIKRLEEKLKELKNQ